MVPPKNFNKDDDLPSDGRDDETDPMPTGTQKVQVTTMPPADAFLSLIPETAGGGNASSGASSTQPHRTKRPNLEMHVVDLRVMKVCRDLDAGNAVDSSPRPLPWPGEPSVQSEVKMVEAMSTFLKEWLGDMPDPSGGTAEEQARREEVRKRYYKRIEEIKKRLVTRRNQPGWWI
ncbi:hypothetical protein INS49_007854 [Diaporthe citri]|uniref:uncharacterized protein n=1 Tax=Diaporthe citri TaxID=83186 RepID=UPI001C7FAE85|nr:uncharacterized protein INS49_007854 [Diaporthe citri]KAG6362760.1 hypothetical protein INS49_007854 [Diaporthe citri]